MSDKKLHYQCFISSKYLFCTGKAIVEGDYDEDNSNFYNH